ncbi:replication-relaxation family protein [Streptomyces adustus]|uniref:replication-relaxation family protein n=1 Tax=Streptomyces adustus TaxID=1609272 RepID=UPI00371B0FDA
MPLDLDAAMGDRMALAVVAQYRLVTTKQLHGVIAPWVRIEQTRRRLVKLREEGLVRSVTLPRAGRHRAWFATRYGVQVASEWPELRDFAPPRLIADASAARLRVAHALAMTGVGVAFQQDARARGDVCRPLDWIPEVHHPLGGGEAVIPDALLFYQEGNGAMLRAFVEVDRATMGPERLAAKLGTYSRLHSYVSAPPPGRSRPVDSFRTEPDWRRRYPLFPRLLFVLDATGPAGIDNRIHALHAAAKALEAGFLLHDVPVLAAPMTDLLQHGPSAPVWRPVQDPAQRVGWTSRRRQRTTVGHPAHDRSEPGTWPAQT